MKQLTASIFLLLCVFGSALSLTYEEAKSISILRHQTNLNQSSLDSDYSKIAKFIEGIYAMNKLSNPTSVLSCFDDSDVSLIASSLSTLFSLASLEQTMIDAYTTAQNIVNKLNPTLFTCLATNPQIMELSEAYNLSSINPQSALAYYINNMHMIARESSYISYLLSQSSYEGAGYSLAGFIHSVLDVISQSSNILQDTLSNFEIMQEYYNGFYAQQGLPNPTYISQCYSDAPVNDFVVFQPKFLKKAGSVATISEAFSDLEAFDNEQAEKYPEVNECLQGNEEIAALKVALGIKHPETVNDTVKEYINNNLFSTTNEFNTAYKSWTSAKYSQSGKQVSAWTKKSLAKN